MSTMCFVVYEPLAYGISQRKPHFFYLMKCETVIGHGKRSVEPAYINRESSKYSIDFLYEKYTMQRSELTNGKGPN